MFAVTALLVLVLFALAAVSPQTFVYFCLWVLTIPYWWNFDVQITFSTPLGPMNLIAMQLFGFLGACFAIVVRQIDRVFEEIKLYRWHLIFIGFCLLSLIYAPSPAYGIRTLAKLLGPPMFMIVVLLTIKSPEELRRAQNAILGSGVIILALALIAKALGARAVPEQGLATIGPPGMGPAVFCAHMLPVSMLAFAAYLCERKMKYLVLTVAFAISIAVALQRTSAGALFLGFSLIAFFATRGIARLVLPVAGVMGLPVLLVFNDAFRKRMFFQDKSSQDIIADPTSALQSVDASGRFALWDRVLRRFFDPHPIVGSGIGSTQDLLYSANRGQGVVHSEYVRLLCEVGLLGLSLFVAAAVAYLLIIKNCVAHANGASQRTPALAALGSLVAYLIYFATDNGIDYVSQIGIYVFALIAVAVNAGRLASVPSPSRAEPVVADARPFPNLMR
jgi:hypothetical protein